MARSLAERGSQRKIEVVTLGRPNLDLAGPANSIICEVQAAKPDVIVSAAAYTQVDKAESEPDLAFAVNERGAAALARAAQGLGVPIIHLSTDYVFDGSKAEPYVETDQTAPTSVYGSSKLAGEKAVLLENRNSAILRTAWVYSPFGANFVKTMLRLGETREHVGVVADQRGNPTSALDIADAVFVIAENLLAHEGAEQRGIFHMTAAGEGTWAGFAEALFAASDCVGGPSARVNRITTADFPTPAKRPANSRLDCSRLLREHGVRLPDWRESLQTVVERLVRPELSGVGIQ